MLVFCFVKMSLDVMQRVADALGVSVSDIVSGLEKEPVGVQQKVNGSTREVMDMIDLFYANKEMSERIKQSEMD